MSTFKSIWFTFKGAALLVLTFSTMAFTTIVSLNESKPVHIAVSVAWVVLNSVFIERSKLLE